MPIPIGEYDIGNKRFVIVAVIAVRTYSRTRHLHLAAPGVLATKFESTPAVVRHHPTAKTSKPVALCLVKVTEVDKVVVLEHFHMDIVLCGSAHGKVTKQIGIGRKQSATARHTVGMEISAYSKDIIRSFILTIDQFPVTGIAFL